MFYPERCDLCGECLEFCPYVDYDLKRAKYEMRALVEGGVPPIVSLCTTCAACNQVCPTRANPFDLINQRQEESGALEIPDKALENFHGLHNLPTVVTRGEHGKPVMNLCIVGDMVRDQLDNPLFEGLTMVEGADYFCTVGYIHLGKPGIVKKETPRFIEKLFELGSDEIICFHDDCYALLTTMALEYGFTVPFRPVHLFEFLCRQLAARSDQIKKLSLKVSYQAPCASRYTPDKDIFLDKLLELLGVERVKRRYDRLNGLCCGAPLMAVDRKRALEIKCRNIKDAKESGAEAMVFLCPMCYLNLRSLCRKQDIKPIFITELCAQALQ